jgi:hypothetical protein
MTRGQRRDLGAADLKASRRRNKMRRGLSPSPSALALEAPMHDLDGSLM